MLAVAIASSMAAGIVSGMARRWTRNTILPAVVGGVLVGLIALLFGRGKKSTP